MGKGKRHVGKGMNTEVMDVAARREPVSVGSATAWERWPVSQGLNDYVGLMAGELKAQRRCGSGGQ